MLYFKRLLLEFKLIRELYKDNYIKGNTFWPTLIGQNFTIIHIGGNMFTIKHNDHEHHIENTLIKILFNRIAKKIDRGRVIFIVCLA